MKYIPLIFLLVFACGSKPGEGPLDQQDRSQLLIEAYACLDLHRTSYEDDVHMIPVFFRDGHFQVMFEGKPVMATGAFHHDNMRIEISTSNLYRSDCRNHDIRASALKHEYLHAALRNHKVFRHGHKHPCFAQADRQSAFLAEQYLANCK
jgi:hypothetical protein